MLLVRTTHAFYCMYQLALENKSGTCRLATVLEDVW